MDPKHRDYWFRSSDWTQEARDLFEAKLLRARGAWSKSQYLKIKALYLVRSDDRDAILGGIQLLHRFLEDYPADWLQLPLVLQLLAEGYAKIGDKERAGRYLAQASGAEDETGGSVSTVAKLDLAEFLIELGEPARYGEAEGILDAFADRRALAMNSEGFRYFVAKARLAARMGRPGDASTLATMALKIAMNKKPQFPRHPKVGIVNPDRTTLAELAHLAELA